MPRACFPRDFLLPDDLTSRVSDQIATKEADYGRTHGKDIVIVGRGLAKIGFRA
jgi:hypothetical protein